MTRKKTSKKQKFCFKDMPITPIKKGVGVRHRSADAFRDEAEIAHVLFQCLVENDVEGFLEILDTFLRVNRTKIARETNLSRSTVQQALSGKGNPTLRTIAKIIHQSVA